MWLDAPVFAQLQSCDEWRRSKAISWRWYDRFIYETVEDLVGDKTRLSWMPALAPEIAYWVVARTLEDPSGQTTHETSLMMANEVESASVR